MQDSYVYSIVPAADRMLAAITSADELLLLDRETLQVVSGLETHGVPTGVTCLERADSSDHLLLCSGRDGSVASFDTRTREKVSSFKLGAALYLGDLCACF